MDLYPDNRRFLVAVIFNVWISCLAVASGRTTVLVESPFGTIQGLKTSDPTTGESYVTFKGIPYAKPPLGDLRFAKPQPHPKLDGVFDATKEGKTFCPYPDGMAYGETDFTEDCLILNIHMKDVTSYGQPLKKVMVLIHGGAFVIGSSSQFIPQSFVTSQDVIVVTINYRLGVLGFLSTENEAIPGNYGLWDQTLALRWVKDNIWAFGGDPDDVTIAGESAGGASVGYQMITPHTKGLFSKAHPMSGTASSNFARAINTLSLTLMVAKSAGCWDKDTNHKPSVEESINIVECLRKAPVSVFTAFTHAPVTGTFFVPRVDGDFIPDLPSNLLEDDAYLESIGFFNRTYLIGMNNLESAIIDVPTKTVKAVIFASNETSIEEKELAWQERVEKTFQFNLLAKVGEKGASDERLVNTVREFYGRRHPDDYNVMIDMASDLYFLIPALEYARAASRRESSPVYFFYFDHYPLFMKGSVKGMPHSVDLAYWLDVPLENSENVLKVGIQGQMEGEDLELKKVFSSLLGDFIRSGYPGTTLNHKLLCDWPTYGVRHGHYLNFNPAPWVSYFLEKDKQDLWFNTVPRMLNKRHAHSEL